jgi:ADP-ribosyl-[dinitrogen reductase] hydrolase
LSAPRDPALAPAQVSRAQAALIAHLSGDALGSLVEFKSVDWIHAHYPDGVRTMADGGTFKTLAGQPTDDGEMTLALARSLVERGAYDDAHAKAAYVRWINSNPFDRGTTIANALAGVPTPNSQANGALMRVAPIGIFGARRATLDEVAIWAESDAAITHPHLVCRQANALYAMAIAHAIATGPTPAELHDFIRAQAAARQVDPALVDLIALSTTQPPRTYTEQIGWVLIAFHNALWQLLHAPSLEEGIVGTIMRGGDTDTNAAIAGALLGSVYGMRAVPERWTATLANCRADQGGPRSSTCRPEIYWPVDAADLAVKLLG